MGRIRILPDQVANQIAAGEVVERPAAVLKELIENSIDAKATCIRVERRGGGKSLIRVSDNGHGMSRDDAILCLERHATSKIFESADIGEIHTLGFRGEAIPSIASISRFRILTREATSAEGTEIDIHGGKILAVKGAGCAVGCEIEVRNLFYNLPARKKFLRSDTTELGHLHHVFFLHAIAHPQIAWTLHQDQRPIYDLSPAPPSVEESPALLARIKALHGNTLASQLLPIEWAREGIRIQGFIGKPGLSRSNRSELYCFVNSRPVDSRAIYYGLIEGYHSALMRGRYPVCFLFLNVDPSTVDVNIHPAKREVRFREDARVQGSIVEAVRRALGATPHQHASSPLEIKVPIFGAQSKYDPSLETSFPHHGQTQLPLTSSQKNETQSTESSAVLSPPLPEHSPTPSGGVSSPLAPQTESSHPIVSTVILGVFDELYVIAMDEQGLLIVDQHAAHERILYEKMMRQFEKGEAVSQRLLLPQTIELSPKDTLELKKHLARLERMGFGIAEFGDRSFMIDSIPGYLHFSEPAQLIRSLLDELAHAGSEVNRDRFAEEMIAKTVCRHAVKANDRLKTQEIDKMLIDLRLCTQPLTCPHGRPTILRLTRAELEKKFGRRPPEF
jgi:DNA mismatch repair protein MutL